MSDAGQEADERPSDADPIDPAGVADGFERLWTPHRMRYIQGADRPVDESPGQGCPFCHAPEREDEAALLVARGEHAYVVLNLYPYNPGHLLVCPYRHVAEYTELTLAESGEMVSLTQAAMRTVRAVSQPRGFNVGMNIGAVAGAGIAGHLHQHVVPRWSNDANFLPIIARTKALPELLGDTRRRIAAAWPGSTV
jgi:ATP adenylyltransferase